MPAFPLTHSPRREVVSGAGSHEGGPPHGFWGHVTLITQSTVRDGGVVDAVVPCGTSALMTQTTLRNGGVVDAVVPCGL